MIKQKPLSFCVAKAFIIYEGVNEKVQVCGLVRYPAATINLQNNGHSCVCSDIKSGLQKAYRFGAETLCVEIEKLPNRTNPAVYYAENHDHKRAESTFLQVLDFTEQSNHLPMNAYNSLTALLLLLRNHRNTADGIAFTQSFLILGAYFGKLPVILRHSVIDGKDLQFQRMAFLSCHPAALVSGIDTEEHIIEHCPTRLPQASERPSCLFPIPRPTDAQRTADSLSC